ncbi:MAG: 8-amino-7-oxononanoate synthase [Myxococcaceae bacterium]|nr:8-amino-7-oxononanoate synthase [Myxococcaceae bacterium]
MSAAHPERVIDGWAEEELRTLQARGLRRELEPLSTPQGPVVQLGGETLINFSSNDYLGLAGDPRLGQAATAALSRHGVGTGASRLVVGDTLAHRALEAKLAAFMGAESALLFNAGYAANVGVLSALAGKEDVLFSDALNHASLIDGCRLSRAKTVVYPHRDVDALERLLRAHRGRRQMVCTDAVFSMDGDRAPLRELVALCRQHGAALVVDEAHAIGVLGDRGAGLCEALGVSGEVDLRVGTLGKALGAFGAFVAGSRAVTELLVHRARSLVFSTALPAAVCEAARTGLGLVEDDPSLRAALWRNIRHFAEGLQKLGHPATAQSAIFAVILGEPRAAVEASRFLRTRGLLVKAIRPPTVPEGTSRLRFGLSAAHTPEHIERALDALRELARNA